MYPVSSFAHSDEKNARHDELDSAFDRSDPKASDAPYHNNLDVIKSSDWIIDLGPEGGDGGGEIVAEGTPEMVSAVKKSYTGQFLEKII